MVVRLWPEEPSGAEEAVTALLANSSDGACLLDARQRIVFWNRRAEALMGFSAGEVEGLPCWEVFQARRPDGEAVCQRGCAIATCLLTGKAAPNQTLLAQAKDGSHVALAFSTAALPLPAVPALTGALFFREGDAEQLPSAVDLWEFHSFGRFEIRKNGVLVPLKVFGRRQAVTLLKVLLSHHGRPVHREQLTDILWPEANPREGMQRLKVLVHALRRVLEKEGATGQVLVTRGESYQLNAGPAVWTDVAAFKAAAAKAEAAIQARRHADALEHIRYALCLCQGEYLPEDPYADWSVEERESLSGQLLTLLLRGAVASEALGEPDEAETFYRAILARDPTRETVHRSLMELLWQRGRAGEAIQQYRQCSQVLALELGVRPGQETISLYERIRLGR